MLTTNFNRKKNPQKGIVLYTFPLFTAHFLNSRGESPTIFLKLRLK